MTAPAGFSGSSAYQAQPACGQNITSNYASLSPRLDFQVNFTRTGTHYVWIHGRGNSGSSNSVHAGLDGVDGLGVVVEAPA